MSDIQTSQAIRLLGAMLDRLGGWVKVLPSELKDAEIVVEATGDNANIVRRAWVTAEPLPFIKIGNDEYYDLSKISELLGVQRYHLVNAARRGEFGSRKIGKTYLVTAADFNNYIKTGRLTYTPRSTRSKFEKPPFNAS